MACLGSAAHLLTAATAIPFGPIRFTEEIGPKFFDQLGWPMPLLWILAVLNSRGVARMILRPWRKLRVYGFWLIGLTVVLTVAFDVALEPYAAHSRHYWIWLPTRLPLTWHTAPVSNFPAWALTAGLILAFASPSLINKDQRPRKSKPDAHPLILWLLAVLFLSANSAQAGFLSAAAFGIAAAVIAAAFAIRGARW
ncbi:MAG: carotenoid biosynthesis protein [Verrucomicrobia bacterium]|nr:MAG: carotenoid biosynthesis protein [Verrucomicrobiota bacterium]